MSGSLLRLVPLGQPGGGAVPGPAAVGGAAGLFGAKAARLAAARHAGFPVLPGWIVPVGESRPAIRDGALAVRDGRPAAARRAVLGRPVDPALASELREAAIRLGGRVIVRSSSPLEGDPRWSGAFSSVAEVGPGDVATAVRSCWASAFAVDPLARLEAAGLPPEALELAILIQPEIEPAAGGLARVIAGPGAAGTMHEVVIDGIAGHPGALLSGWADGQTARACLPGAAPGGGAPDAGWPDAGRPAFLAPDGPLNDVIGRAATAAVASLAWGVHRVLGDTTIEWAYADGTAWLLQSAPQAAAQADGAASPGPGPDAAGHAGGAGHAGRAVHPEDAGRLAGREWMPALAELIRARGRRLQGRPAAAGLAAGRLVACQPHVTQAADCRDAILLVDRPVPALAPLLFAARGVIARGGGAGSHLAEVARSLAVPMVTGCHPETVTTATTGPGAGAATGSPASWLAAVDGTTGEVALLPS